jgi:hypothetical protein
LDWAKEDQFPIFLHAFSEEQAQFYEKYGFVQEGKRIVHGHIAVWDMVKIYETQFRKESKPSRLSNRTSNKNIPLIMDIELGDQIGAGITIYRSHNTHIRSIC